jgi:ribosomal protein S18 acetylase RimI-like enzyme
MKIQEGICFSLEQIRDLYLDAEWYSYLKNESDLWKAIEKSLEVFSIIENDKLIGFVRVLGDGITAVLIQDIIIRKEYQSKGIGKKLLNHVLEYYAHSRQIIILCDDEERLKSFYEASGLKEVSELGIKCFGNIK